MQSPVCWQYVAGEVILYAYRVEHNVAAKYHSAFLGRKEMQLASSKFTLPMPLRGAAELRR